MLRGRPRIFHQRNSQKGKLQLQRPKRTNLAPSQKLGCRNGMSDGLLLELASLRLEFAPFLQKCFEMHNGIKGQSHILVGSNATSTHTDTRMFFQRNRKLPLILFLCCTGSTQGLVGWVASRDESRQEQGYWEQKMNAMRAWLKQSLGRASLSYREAGKP